MKKINALCKKALTITDSEIEEVEAVARQQLRYCSPLKNATTAKQHALGRHNMAVAQKVRELRDTIAKGAGAAG